MKSWNLVIDVARCHDCNDCFLADKDEFVGNEFPPYSAAQPWHGHRWMNIKRKERGQYPMVQTAYLPTPCLHCDDAPCLTADGAVYKREDGLVIIDPVKARAARRSSHLPVRRHSLERRAAAPPEVHRLRPPDRRRLAGHALLAGVPHGRDQAGAATTTRWRGSGRRRAGGFRPELGPAARVLQEPAQVDEGLRGRHVVVDKASDECVEGAPATVVLDGRAVGEATTNNFGDFVVDRLEPGEEYIVTLAADGLPDGDGDGALEASLTLETVFLEKA